MVEEFDINSNECLGKFDFITHENFNTFLLNFNVRGYSCCNDADKKRTKFAQ